MNLGKLSEIFQDTDGGASMKRAAFAVFVIFFIAVSLLVLLHGIPTNVEGFASATLDKTQDIIKWLGAYILGDKAPAVVRAFKGTSEAPNDHPTGG